MADAIARDIRVSRAGGRAGLGGFMRRRSTIAFFMAFPLIAIIACLGIYPALYALHLATLNKSMQHFAGFGNLTSLFNRSTLCIGVEQSVPFPVTAGIFKALLGFIIPHLVHNILHQA